MFPPNSDQKSASQSRQRRGLACEECQRRKSRCDGRQPRCGVCEENGIICTINTSRPARGPKQGYLKALRIRVGILPCICLRIFILTESLQTAELERCLVEQQYRSPSDSSVDLERPDRNTAPPEKVVRMPTVTPEIGAEFHSLDEFGVSSGTPKPRGATDSDWISEMMREELYV
jgi:hypothetical protein